MWLSSAWVLLLAASPSLAVVIRATPNPATAHNARSGHSQMKAALVAAVNASGTLENVPGRYVTTITLNGRDFRVAIDTGSSDLWVVAPPDFQYDSSGAQPVQINYGGGPVNGTTGFTSMQLGNYSVSQQAFMNATFVGVSGIVDLGLDGLMGMAFNNLAASDITQILGPQSSPSPQPFLFNIFDQTPNVDNFIGISLSRTGDLEGSADASFTINELDDDYATVSSAPQLPLFPGTNGRWSILVDAISVDGVGIPIGSVVPNAPNGSLVVLMDTGTPTASLPPDILYAIYSQIPGASVAVQDDQMLFVIPCNSTSIVTVTIGGLPYPFHPLDLSDIYTPVDNGDGQNYTACISSISSSPGNPEFDALFGDTFMRNVYSVFNFGSSIANSPTPAASMQLLSQTDPAAAVVDVVNVRMAQLASLDPEFVGVPEGFVAATPGSSRPLNSTLDGSDDGSAAEGAVHTSGAVADSTQDSSGNSDFVNHYGVIIIALLSANLLVVLILAVIGIALFVKRNGKIGGSSRAPKYAPVKITMDEPRKSEVYDEDRRYSD
ncbi:aspartic peptidase domain-containing protein [Mycena rosella]|uniref:Aspartic peptidase domain-containing protein n=1 Tax=Mycena rosella TaxID=1033263 RepID=A0AAD7CRP6_MYCRO|nr:aspartic peptidase domain-containing protein [Mycena rosella]